MLGQTTIPLLQNAEQAVSAKVPPASQQAFQSAVNAGLRVMYAPLSHKLMLAQLTKPGDPVQNVAEGAAKLMGLLYRQSGNGMPVAIMVPAAMVLMCEGLDFLAKARGAQITPQLLALCTQQTGAAMLQLLGVSQQQMHQVVAHGLHRMNQMRTQQGQQSQQGQRQQLVKAAQPGGIISGVRVGR